MNRHHAEVLKRIMSRASAVRNRASSKAYLGNTSKTYNIPSPELRAIAKECLAADRSLTPETTIELVDSLMGGDSHEEKKAACFILGLRKPARSLVTIAQLDQWLHLLNGWAEIDALCQNIFTVEDVSPHWEGWNTFLLALSKDGNINRRRASLVFLIGLTRKSDAEQFHRLAQTNIQTLKAEKAVLITKAISWLLRCMIKTRRAQTEAFLEENAQTLPAIAVRETRTKLKLGKKA